jgi:hypothetical protein
MERTEGEEQTFKTKLNQSSVFALQKKTYDGRVSFFGGVDLVHDWQIGVATALVNLGRRFALVFLLCEIRAEKYIGFSDK